VRSHAQKFFMKLASQNKSPGQGNQGMLIHPGGNPDRDPSIPVAAIMRLQHEQQSVDMAAATVAAGSEGGTSAAAAAAFNAAHIKMSEADVDEIREGVRNGQRTLPAASSPTRGRGGGSGSPHSSGCSSAAARSSAVTALHGGDASGASPSGSGGPTGGSAGGSGEASNTGSNDDASDGTSGTGGGNSEDGSEQGFSQGFFGGAGMEAHDVLSGANYAYGFPMGA
jgi:hypothetical protein